MSYPESNINFKESNELSIQDIEGVVLEIAQKKYKSPYKEILEIVRQVTEEIVNKKNIDFFQDDYANKILKMTVSKMKQKKTKPVKNASENYGRVAA